MPSEPPRDLEAVFAAEAAQRLAVLEAGIEHPERLGVAELGELRREAHTLRGAAAVLGLDAVAAHAEAAESRLERAEEEGSLSPQSADAIASALASLRTELAPRLT